MKILKAVIFFIFMMLFYCSESYSAQNIYGAYGLTGGAAGDLDKIDGSTLTDKDMAFVILSTFLTCSYVLDDDANQADSSETPCPRYIQPDTSPGTKSWVLNSMAGQGFTAIKISSTAGEQLLYEANSTDTNGTGWKGPASVSSDTLYQFSNTSPAAANGIMAFAVKVGDDSAQSWLYLDDTAGNGDTTKLYSADKIFDLLALKAPLDSPTFTTALTAAGLIDYTDLSATAKFQSIISSDLGDTTSPHVLTTAESVNKCISNYNASGADRVFTMPAAHAAGNVIFTIGDEFQVDIEPDSGENFYLNGTAMANDEHIQNTADTLGQRIVGYCANINGSLTWMFYSSDTDWVEETP